eukprot:m.40463 g.40463  ORF g.40463 m.40463 type:complete len:246 (-) comp18505_c0_seq1:380-1117(-)
MFTVCRLVLVVSLAMQQPPVSVVRDKLLGSVLLGAWGDALGAPTEQGGFAGNISSTELWGGNTLEAFPLRIWDDTPWGTWPPMDKIVGKRGVFTDDTSIHLTILQPWLLTLQKEGSLHTELGLWQYMNATESALWQDEQKNTTPPIMQITLRRRQMLSDYLGMYAKVGGFPVSEGATRANQSFFLPGYPACFGTYMFLEMAAALPLPPHAVFELFSGRAGAMWRFRPNLRPCCDVVASCNGRKSC